ncbi:MAG: tRNA pseudouridine(55) synthase TruB [Proteobacteria bacterium]|nr:tRNA pseudouridine(55) synthase TruB [Pseudomonadota bacterium]
MPSGVLLLDKPLGLSSNAALQRVRALFGREKAGHVGSLDPLATGMLPVCLGEATKIAGDILSGAKCYRFTACLGTATRTGDAEGEVTRTAPVPALRHAQVTALLDRFVGTSTQVPPMYSALKQGGQALYRLARAGIEVPRAARTIEIRRLALLGCTAGALELEVVCSKGTYVRVLAEDIAAALGTCAHVSALRRLWVEPFEGAAMHTLESLQAACAAGQPPALIPIDQPLGHLPAVHLSGADAERVLRGQRVFAECAAAPRVRLYDPSGAFLGLGAADGDGSLQPRRLLRATGP